MWTDPHTWVLIAFVAFLGLFGKKIGTFAVQSLDARARRIGHELSEAEDLRVQAEKTLALYKQKYVDSMQEAENIIARARKSAEQMVTQAEADLKAAMERRTRQAMERIKEEEKNAVAEVRDHVVDITIAAARSIVIEQLRNSGRDEVVRRVIADLERKVH